MNKMETALTLLVGFLGLSAGESVTSLDGLCKGVDACIGIPAGCEKNEATCDVLGKVTLKGQVANVELYAQAGKANKLMLKNRWVGLGFNEDGQMSPAPVIACFDENSGVSTKLTYNNEAFVNVGWRSVDQSQITPGASSLNNNLMTCQASIKRQISISSNKFDLAGKRHALILGTGTMSSGRNSLDHYDNACAIKQPAV